MAKIKLYRGIGADTKQELDKYIKDFYDLTKKAKTYGGGGNLGNGYYFTTDKNEAIAYSKANDYKDWKYSHVFELEVDDEAFLKTDNIDYNKMLELDSEYKRLDSIMKSNYHNEDDYINWVKAEDKALEKYVQSVGKKGITDGQIFTIQNKDIISNVEKTASPISKVKSTTYWDNRAIRRMTDAEKMSDVAVERVKKIYNQAYRNIDIEIARVYKNYAKDTGLDVEKLKELLTKKETDKVWKTLERQGLTKYIKNNYKSRISRLEQIQAQIYGKAKLIYPKEELENTMCYKGVINDSYYKTIYDTQMGTGFDFSFNKIDNNMTNALLNESWSGKNYSERIWGNTDILAETVSQVVGGALISGQSIDKTSKQIRDRFNVGQYYAERLVRTETNHFNNEADAMAYEDMGINKYVFVATLDSRTSLICQEMDNKVFDYKDREEGVNYPPLHPNCRSKTRGYLGEDGEKLLKRRARNPITGKTEVIDNTSYKDWYKKNVTQYGQEGINKAYKMVKNKASDKEQYNRYKQYLGKDVRSFDNFVKIKYNNKDEWDNVKSYVSLCRRNDIPTGLSFNKYNNNMQDNNWEAINFSPNKIDKHIDKHLKEFDFDDKDTYINNAINLMNNTTVETFTNSSGYVFKYDKNKNEFGTAKKCGIIETYFKPKKGIEYWEEQIKKYGK